MSLSFSSADNSSSDFPIQAPTAFAKALKRVRFQQGWTQADLARYLTVTERAVTSWETAKRLPGPWAVALLAELFSEDEQNDFRYQELVYSYLVEDLARQAKNMQYAQSFRDRVGQVVQRILQLPFRQRDRVSQRSLAEGVTRERERTEAVLAASRSSQSDFTSQEMLPQLATMLQVFQQHPDLIPVTGDFLRQMVAQE